MPILSKLYQKYGKEVISSSEDVLNLITPIKRKNQVSRVILIGGSDKYRGALVMSGFAALRNGMHGVILIAPEKICMLANNLIVA
jgi:NAD(P)H-hydrate repair Nnr-like enzyme with NAD(P)H-hydrate dehydratase domain